MERDLNSIMDKLHQVFNVPKDIVSQIFDQVRTNMNNAFKYGIYIIDQSAIEEDKRNPFINYISIPKEIKYSDEYYNTEQIKELANLFINSCFLENRDETENVIVVRDDDIWDDDSRIKMEEYIEEVVKENPIFPYNYEVINSVLDNSISNNGE